MSRTFSELRITEIFYSLQGESKTVGLPTVFIRLTGCPLRCQYCDTEYAFRGGKKKSIEQVLAELKAFGCQRVCVTGGEPLAQPACFTLLQLLCDQDYEVSLETSGAIDLSRVDSRVYIVMDLKTPDSKESSKNLLSNLDHLKPTDALKFVICSEEDYQWSKSLVAELKLDKLCEVFFSPSFSEISPAKLADWIVADKLNVRFQLQLHKVLWDDEPGR